MSVNRGLALAVIAARGGSKGLPRKNILPLGGRPLIAWTIEAACKAACIGRVIVSTDDSEIADVAVAAGADVPFVRPAELANDTATSADVLAHALKMVPDFETAVLLQPTSPFRTACDLDIAFADWQASTATGCVSICSASESPWLMFGRAGDGRIERLLPMPAGGLRRQDLPTAYVLNGAFYFVQTVQFLKDRSFVGTSTMGKEMPILRSLDIDTQTDLDIARNRLAAWGGIVPQECW